MKVLSLTQPWATLVVLGAKKFETRSWATQYRGPLLIHAAKRFTKADAKLCREWPFDVYIKFDGASNQDAILPRGAIIGRVNLVACLPTNHVRPQIDKRELAFGDYSPGRYAWRLENFYKFEEPIAAKGALGLWEFPWQPNS